MQELIYLLKESFELFVKMRWQKRIEKECDKYNRLNKKANMQGRVVNELVKRYNEIYSENLKGEQ